MMAPRKWLAFLDAVAGRADAIAMDFFHGRRFTVEEKPDLSPVTEADRAIEKAARDLAREQFPDLGIHGEELGLTQGGSPTRLIIDPIDATRNFIRGIPVFASLLAIEDRGEIVAGVVSAPALRARWRAARGLGAFLNDQPIRVSRMSRLDQAQAFHGDIAGLAEPEPPPGFTALLERTQRARGFGDFYQHVLVAQGAGELSLDSGVKPWDIAPLQVIVEEAGGRATTLAGERSIYQGSLVCTNGLLHEQVLDALGRSRQGR
jgi:histidinol-phosphatase